jgi:cysteine-rich repeat protein
MFARAILSLLLAALSGCSFIDDFGGFQARREAGASGPDEAGTPDAELSEDGGEDAEPADGGEDAEIEDAGGDASVGPGDELCAGERDGTPCGGTDQPLICLKGFCRTSRCGDGFVDAMHDEQCDDANLMRDDGCEPASCRFSCTVNADCDNGFVCDGDELCDVHGPRCMKDEVPTTNKPCTRDGVAGVCNDKGYCVSPGCGDGVVDAGEECDPMQLPPAPGCRADCTQGCTDDAQCRDQDDCNGDESCEPSTGACEAGAPLACQDGDACTQDGQCEPASGCVFALLDGDGDQVSAQTCAPGSTHQGGDCDDADASVYPGATEYCDGLDNDCDKQRDEGAVMAVCYPDRDRDGYPDREGGSSACSCPAGTRPPRADEEWDCWDDPRDGGNDVHPGQQAYFDEPYDGPCADNSGGCKSFDYDCDGRDTPLYRAGPAACNVLGAGLTCSGEGYSGGVPACGANAAYLICQGGGLLQCTSKTEQRRQVCH